MPIASKLLYFQRRPSPAPPDPPEPPDPRRRASGPRRRRSSDGISHHHHHKPVSHAVKSSLFPSLSLTAVSWLKLPVLCLRFCLVKKHGLVSFF
jgi:hypothetical protein